MGFFGGTIHIGNPDVFDLDWKPSQYAKHRVVVITSTNSAAKFKLPRVQPFNAVFSPGRPGFLRIGAPAYIVLCKSTNGFILCDNTGATVKAIVGNSAAVVCLKSENDADAPTDKWGAVVYAATLTGPVVSSATP